MNLLTAWEARQKYDANNTEEHEKQFNDIMALINESVLDGRISLADDFRPAEPVKDRLRNMGYDVEFVPYHNSMCFVISWESAKEPQPTVKWNGDQSGFTQ